MTITDAVSLGQAQLHGASTARTIPPIRQRNAARVAIGTLVLVVSILGVVALTAHTGATRRVFVVRHRVAAGEPLRPADLGTVAVDASLPAPVVTASQRDQILGHRAAVTLMPGALLVRDQIGESTDVSGTALVGATLSPGQYPSTLEVGDRVLVVTSDAAAGAAAIADPHTDRGVLVALVPGASSSDPTAVTLRMPIAAATSVAAAGAGHVSLVSVGP
jgi:hypothetical protein